MISNKIKALLHLKNKKHNSLVEVFGLSRPQALNTKFQRDSFTAKELIQIADLTGTTLAFIDDKGEPLIKFDMDDLKKGDD